MSDFVRSSCEDGRDFIRKVVVQVLEDPFPAYGGPRLSRLQERQQKRQREKQSSGAHASKTEGSDAPSPLPRHKITHFVMNLPDSALEFLDAFQGILTPQDEVKGRLDGVYATMPMVHCYCFTRELDAHKAEADIRQVCGHAAGYIICADTGYFARGPRLRLEPSWRAMSCSTRFDQSLQTRICTASASGSPVR